MGTTPAPWLPTRSGRQKVPGCSIFAATRVVLAGHGFGAIVASWAARELGGRCAGLVLVDGGWEALEETSGMDVDEFLRGLDEPPEVMRSMSSFLADRRGFDPDTWDADQEHAARATVVETHAGRVVPSTRPHAATASVRAMFTYDPLRTLPEVLAPVVALVASDDESASRTRALGRASAARVAHGLTPIVHVPCDPPATTSCVTGRLRSARRSCRLPNRGRRDQQRGRSMQVVYSPAHLGHDVALETFMGMQVPANEVAERAERIAKPFRLTAGLFRSTRSSTGRRRSSPSRPGLVRFLEVAWSELRGRVWRDRS